MAQFIKGGGQLPAGKKGVLGDSRQQTGATKRMSVQVRCEHNIVLRFIRDDSHLDALSFQRIFFVAEIFPDIGFKTICYKFGPIAYPPPHFLDGHIGCLGNPQFFFSVSGKG